MLVSIITPTYNHEAFIERCIRSVLAQTHAAWEIIVIDDGSTDRTGELVGAFDDSRIRYVRQDHAGIDSLAATYNKALALAKGDLIAILEGDDYWPPTKLEKQVSDFADEGVVLSFGITQEVSETGAPLKEMPSSAVPRDALVNTPVGRAARYMLDVDVLTFLFPVSVVIRRSALDRIGGFRALPSLPLVDYPTFLELTCIGRFAFHPEVLGYWQRHAQSTTRNRFYRILAGVHHYGERFYRQHAARLPISDDDRAAIVHGWNKLHFLQWLTLGRWFLSDREFASARRAFLRGRRVATDRRQLAVIGLGIAASFAHLDLEPLAPRLKLDPLRALLAAVNSDNVTVSKQMLDE